MSTTTTAHRVWWPKHLVMEGELSGSDRYGTALMDAGRTYRYALTRRWSDGPTTAFIVLNPTAADAGSDDAAVLRCCAIAQHLGSGQLLLLSLFAARTTQPQSLRNMPDPVGADNDAVIAASLAPGVFDLAQVVAGWGNTGRLQHRDLHVDGLVRRLGVDPVCLGMTNDVTPRHPLRLAPSTPVEPFPPVLA